MKYIIYALFSFFLASIFITNCPFDKFLIILFKNINFYILFLIIISSISYKRIIYEFKKLNLYSFIIIIFYSLGTLVMEYTTYAYSINFVGVLSTSPLIMAFIYFSQKNNNLLLKNGSFSNKDRFKMDLFLMNTSFLLAGCILLIVQLKNMDFISIWPLYLFFISIYGFIFSLIYAIAGIFFNEDHKKYTLFYSLVVILIYSSMSLFQKNGWLFNIINLEPFYAISIILLLFHFIFVLFFIIKKKLLKGS